MSLEKTPGQPGSSLASATAKTQSVIEGLQARLGAESAQRPHRSATVAASRKKAAVETDEEETEEELERQLQTYFARAVDAHPVTTVGGAPRTSPVHDALRTRVIEGVVHRILAEWARHDQELPGGARLGNEIMERLIERVLEQFREVAVA